MPSPLIPLLLLLMSLLPLLPPLLLPLPLLLLLVVVLLLPVPLLLLPVPLLLLPVPLLLLTILLPVSVSVSVPSRLYGTCCVHISHNKIPREYTSLALVCPPPLNTSGAVYSRLPIALLPVVI